MSETPFSENSSADWEATARDLYLAGDYKTAKVAIDKPLALDSMNYDALLLAGGILDELDATDDEIVKLYDRAIAVRPDDAEAYTDKADQLANSDRRVEALEVSRIAFELIKREEVRLRSRAFSVYNVHIDLLHESGKIDEAREVARDLKARYDYEGPSYIWVDPNDA